jgi:hypothetical protein
VRDADRQILGFFWGTFARLRPAPHTSPVFTLVSDFMRSIMERAEVIRPCKPRSGSIGDKFFVSPLWAALLCAC